MRHGRKDHTSPTPVSTMLTAAERAKIDAAASGVYRPLHRTTLEDVIDDLRQNRAGAVLMSLSCCGEQQLSRVARLVREFPRIPAVAVLTENESATPQRVLLLGHTGVRRLIDLRRPGGWSELRSIIMATRTQAIQRSALAQIELDLKGGTHECLKFFEILFTAPPSLNTIVKLASRMKVIPNTLLSRFQRYGLPSPKHYLAMARLVRASELLENPGLSIANVANHLEYSSPQSYGRHVQGTLGMSAASFRARYDGEGMLQRFREELVLPHLATLKTFKPLVYTGKEKRELRRGNDDA